MPTNTNFADYCCDLLASAGRCIPKRMLGGFGISTDGLTIAILADLGDGEKLRVQEAMATAAIEGEKVHLEAVRSSVAHRLGLADFPTVDRHVDGLVQVMADATEQDRAPLTQERLCPWQAALTRFTIQFEERLPTP